MSPGAKVFLTLAGAGAVIGGIILFTSKKAKAQTLPKVEDDTAPPDVVVPPDLPPIGGDTPTPPFVPPGPVPPFVPPFPIFTQPQPPAPPPPPAPPVQPPPPIVTTVPTPVGPVQVQIPSGTQSVPVVVPVPLPDVLASQQGGVPLPPPPAPVPLPPIMPTQQTPPGPVPVQPIPIPVATAPAPAPSSPVATVPKDTAAMVAALLAAETKIGWNTTSAQVSAWQKSRGLVVDGKYGPKSALTVALELATIPIIRFWPKGSQKAPELEKYRGALFELASEADAAGQSARAEQLRFAAEREKAQAFGAVSGKAPPISPELQVSLAKVA